MSKSFRPVESTRNIENSYKSYILSTFHTDVDTYNEQIADLVNNKYEFIKGPFIQLTDNYLKEKSVRKLTQEYLSPEFLNLKSPKFNCDMKLYAHQILALKNIIEKDRSTVVSTGTGSGKTESFLIPIINQLMREVESDSIKRPGVRAMIIYPMNALVNDQIKRLKDILENYPKITFGSFTGETKEITSAKVYEKRYGRPPCENEIYTLKDARETPPNIMITNYAMLEHILIKPENAVEIFNEESADLWKYIVLDEAHTYSGAKGTEVSMLLKRVKKTLNNDKIRFILTSATLGDEDSNNEVAQFANALTGSKAINENDVIRAIRDPPVKPDTTVSLPSESYREILDSDCDLTAIKKYGGVGEEPAQAIGHIILHDEMFWALRESLVNVKPLKCVSDELKIDTDTIVDFIALASKARDKDGNKIFDARYHTFIRSIDGVYMTLSPSNKIDFNACTSLHDNDLGCDFVTYQMSVCYNCNAVFIPGIINDHKLKQTNEVILDDEGNSSASLFMICSNNIDPENDADCANYYDVCSKCGNITPHFVDGVHCECGKEFINTIEEVKEINGNSDKMCKCPKCGQINNKFGIVRDFYLGSEASTSVIASALFNEIPDPIQDSNHEKVKQFLLFSDSRRSASYAAVNLKSTYENVLMHRLIFETLKSHTTEFNEGITYDYLVEYLASLIQDVYGCNPYDKSSRDKSLKLASSALANEAIGSNSSKSLQYAGLIKFSTNVDCAVESLSEKESNDLFNQVYEIIREKGAVNIPKYVNPHEFNERFPSNRAIVKTNNDKTSKESISVFFTERMNNYLNAIIHDKLEINLFIDDLFDQKCVTTGKKKGYSLDLEKFIIEPADMLYWCPTCHKKYPFSIKGVCPNCAQKTLVECPSDFYSSNDHYTKQYRELPLEPLKVKEHTAQLTKKLLSEYQNDFIDQKLNALCCSTTFEMGVDIGSLSVVMLRNVPPSPSNYIQRAGRAGRSADSSAYILTFCKNTSHDNHYFQDPVAMISGKVNTPKISVDNPKIVIRHIFATALAFYWKMKGTAAENAKAMIDSDYMRDIEKYLKSDNPTLNSFVSAIVPEEIKEYSSEEVQMGLSENKWIDGFVGNAGRLSLLKAEFDSDIETITRIKEECKEAENFDGAKSANKTLTTVNSEDTLSFLSRGNIIPKYGFPVDTVYLENARGLSKDDGFELQRDLSMAITEYAPGCQVVANGKIITSNNIKKIKGMEWDRYAYVKCPDCQTTTIQRYVDEETFPHTIECSNPDCHLSNDVSSNDCFIIPKFGFQYNRIERATINKPRRSRGKTYVYKGSQNHKPEEFRIGKITGILEHNIDDELIAHTNDSYWICNNCGFGSKKRCESHNVPWDPNTECGNKWLHQMRLGTVFRTDVAILHFDDECDLDNDGHLSVLYALIEGLALTFNIEKGEISGCLRRRGKNSFDYVLFDNTPGGAGYVKAISETNMPSIVNKSISMLKSCNCGGPEGDCSCYGCLRNYTNQSYHEKLKRGIALRYLEYIHNRFDE